MLNFIPCIFWPLVLAAAGGSLWLWRKNRERKGSWIMATAFFFVAVFILWAVVVRLFGKWWWDMLISLYIPQ